MENEPAQWNPKVGFAAGALVGRRYRVVSSVGTGGMGAVYKVCDTLLDEQVIALKVLHPTALQEDPSARQRIMSEAKIARSLSHPNIVRVYDIGESEDGFVYISMEYVEAQSLDCLFRCQASGSPSRMPQAEVESIFKEIVCGVAYAHENGVIHRDLKPANILVSGDRRIIKVADFGLARESNRETGLTRSGETVGTPMFMAPEQFRGEKVDARADVYALGLIAYQMATGRPPFEADSYLGLALKHINEPLPEITRFSPEIPGWFAATVARAAAKEKEDRFPSACELLCVIDGARPELHVLFNPPTMPLPAALAGVSAPAALNRPAASRTPQTVPSRLLAACVILLLIALGSVGARLRLQRTALQAPAVPAPPASNTAAPAAAADILSSMPGSDPASDLTAAQSGDWLPDAPGPPPAHWPRQEMRPSRTLMNPALRPPREHYQGVLSAASGEKRIDFFVGVLENHIRGRALVAGAGWFTVLGSLKTEASVEVVELILKHERLPGKSIMLGGSRAGGVMSGTISETPGGAVLGTWSAKWVSTQSAASSEPESVSRETRGTVLEPPAR